MDIAVNRSSRPSRLAGRHMMHSLAEIEIEIQVSKLHRSPSLSVVSVMLLASDRKEWSITLRTLHIIRVWEGKDHGQ